MKTNLLLITFLLLLVCPCHAQRLQHLGRGVVATWNASTGVTVSWRRLIQDPENATYNIYVAKKGTESYTKLNDEPLRLTNYSTTLAAVPSGSWLRVTMTDPQGRESEPSVPFCFEKIALNGTNINNAYLSINFKQAGSPIYNHDNVVYTTKFCWPLDIDGDGEMDYIVDRHSNLVSFNGTQGDSGHCIEAYSSSGEHLWTVDLGPNIFEGSGQNDGVTVGDFDGDGKGEVMVQASDGCRLWNKAEKTWGKYLAYGNNTGDSPDTDGDGIVNYTTSTTENPQYYMLVVNGEDGSQKDICPMTLPHDSDNTYTRHNKADYFGDEYPYMTAAMGSAYLNGLQQSAVAQFQLRTKNKTHHYYTYAYGYFDENGRRYDSLRELFTFAFHDNGNPSEFHHIRIGDVDGDGRDEVMNGAFALDHDGKVLWNAGIAHGDRFRLSDINPDIPGQEIFAIQQNAADMLGSILYSARDGQAIKKWYLSSVGDVGRGECMDVDPSHKGYEMWSTMPNIYNAQGEQIGTAKPYPYEGIWWDGDLGRETVMTTGSGNNCPIVVAKYNGTDTWQRLLQISRDANWQLVAENAVRPMFFGDIYGDWREELILKQLVNGEECGLTALTTNYATHVDNIYCLLQDPNYFGQITNRGYYQSPMTSFYLGYDMPRPQLPPFIQEDANSQVFGLNLGDAQITPSDMAKSLYVMPVGGQTLTLNQYDGEADIWKSQQGTWVVSGEVKTSGCVIVSEGTLRVNGHVKGHVDLRARGVLTGSGRVDSLSMEGSLNYAEGVIRPEGTLTVGSSLALNKLTFIEIDADRPSKLHVEGNLTVSSDVYFTVNSSQLTDGEYPLITFTGTFEGDTKHFLTRGLSGLSFQIEEKEQQIVLVVHKQRQPAEGVVWSGAVDGNWDYQTENWLIEGTATSFVAGDHVLFDDSTPVNMVIINQAMAAGAVEVNNTQRYTFLGNGGISGEASLVKKGTGILSLNTKNADYQGATIIEEGTVIVKALADAGTPSSIGAANAAASNLQIGKAMLTIDNASTSTNRGMTLNDTATIHIPSGTCALKGIIRGNGTLVKKGAGQLNITYDGNNSYAGTILEAGTLAQGTWKSTFGTATSPIHVTGNASIIQFDVNSTSTMPNFQNEVTIDEGKKLNFKASSRGNVRGSLKGKGTFAITLPYVRADISTNVSLFEGVYDVLSSNCRFVQAMDFSKATLRLEDGAYAAGFSAGSGKEAAYTHRIGSLKGSGGLGTGTWNIGYLSQDDSFSGSFAAAAKVNKYGEGNLILSGASQCDMNVYQGAIYASNNTQPVTTGTIKVNDGGSLLGQGQVNHVIVNKGGTIGVQTSPSSNALLKSMTIKGTLKVNEGTIRIRYRSNATVTAYDSFQQEGAAALNSPTIFLLGLNDEPILPETEFRLFTGNGQLTINGDVKILPQQPLPGYEWDVTTLATDGTIRLIPSTGILQIENDIPADTDVYDLHGHKVNGKPASGVYIINRQKVYIDSQNK